MKAIETSLTKPSMIRPSTLRPTSRVLPRRVSISARLTVRAFAARLVLLSGILCSAFAQENGTKCSVVALSEKNTSDSQVYLSLVRALEVVLQQTPAGTRLREVYWAASPEIVAIFAKHPEVFDDAKAALLELQPAVAAYLSGKADQFVINQTLVDRLRKVYDDFWAFGSTALKAGVALARSEFNQFEGLAGKTVGELAPTLGFASVTKPVVHLSAPRLQNGALTLEMNYVQGLTYSLWKAEKLAPNEWKPVNNATVNVNGLAVAITDPLPNLATAFYQVRFTPQQRSIRMQVGADNNFSGNPFVQPQDPPLAGGGIDQSLNFGDVLEGRDVDDDVLIGGLGVDVLLGKDGDDVLIGGLEHFHPQKSDRKFGGPGNDILIWAPGDGSDLLDGGPGEDVLILGLVGEVANGQLVFRVSDDQQAGQVYINPATQLPIVDVSHSPGFCSIIDRSSSPDAAIQLEALTLHHLVRFFLRAPADSFESGAQSIDNGLRQTMHLRDVEYLICTTRNGGGFEVLDLTVSSPKVVPLTSLALKNRLDLIVR